MRLGALNPEAPFSGITMPINVPDDDKLADKIIESSRRLYATKYVAPINKTAYKTTPTTNRSEKPSASLSRSVLP